MLTRCCLTPVICFTLQIFSLLFPPLYSALEILYKRNFNLSDSPEVAGATMDEVCLISLGVYFFLLLLQSTKCMIRFALRLSKAVHLTVYQFSVTQNVLERQGSMWSVAKYFWCRCCCQATAASTLSSVDGITAPRGAGSVLEQLDMLAYFRRVTLPIAMYNILCLIPVAINFWNTPTVQNGISVLLFLFQVVVYGRGPFLSQDSTSAGSHPQIGLVV